MLKLSSVHIQDLFHACRELSLHDAQRCVLVVLGGTDELIENYQRQRDYYTDSEKCPNPRFLVRFLISHINYYNYINQNLA